MSHTKGNARLNRHLLTSTFFGDVEIEIGENAKGFKSIITICCCLKNGTPEENEANADRIVTTWNEYDQLKEDNKALREALERFVLFADRMKKHQDEKAGYVTNFESSMVLQAKKALLLNTKTDNNEN